MQWPSPASATSADTRAVLRTRNDNGVSFPVPGLAQYLAHCLSQTGLELRMLIRYANTQCAVTNQSC